MPEYIDRLVECGYSREQTCGLIGKLGGWRNIHEIDGFVRRAEMNERIMPHVDRV